MSPSDMRRLTHSHPTWAVGSPRPGDMVLCATDPLRLGVVTDVRGSNWRKVALAGAAKAIKAAHAAAEQNPISIAVVLKQAEELEGCTVSILGEDRKRLKFWKNSEFWDVVSKGAKSLGSIRLLPKSAAPAVGKRAASGATKAKKKRARK